MTTIEIHDLKSSAKARGKRLKTVRVMIGLTRNALEKKYKISASTIQSWETAKISGLTERGVNRILPILHKEGVSCTANWLLYGIGLGPQPITDIITHFPLLNEISISASEDKAIIQELRTFRHLHPNALDLVISDNGMEPHYKIGDYIAGIPRSGDQIIETVGKDCIVQTIQNKVFFRRVRKGSQLDSYNLLCTNMDTNLFETTLYDQKLAYSAVVIWHRRKNT